MRYYCNQCKTDISKGVFEYSTDKFNRPLCEECQKDNGKAKLTLEHSEVWDKADKDADTFYAYILKLNDGTFYAGHTRELRERISEHRDNQCKTTANKEPRLVYFALASSRKAATSLEAEFKQLILSNERQLRRMIISFLECIRVVDSEEMLPIL